MTTEVTELAPGDIQRDTGISTSAGQPAGFREETPAAAEPMTETQTAAVAHIGELRKQAADPSLDRDKRDALMAKMSELSRHAFLGEKAPAWFGEQKPDPRATSTEEYDPMAGTFSGANETMSEAERQQLVTHAKVKGMDATKATEAVEFCAKAGLDKTTAKIITERIAQHTVMGYGNGAALSQEEHADLRAECVRRFGSEEKATAENAMARAYVEHVGLGEWVDKNAGSLQYDPQVILTLAFKARSLGLKGVK